MTTTTVLTDWLMMHQLDWQRDNYDTAASVQAAQAAAAGAAGSQLASATKRSRAALQQSQVLVLRTSSEIESFAQMLTASDS